VGGRLTGGRLTWIRVCVRACVRARTDHVQLLDTFQYNDSAANDTFQREPYCVKFRLHDTGQVRSACSTIAASALRTLCDLLSVRFNNK